MTSRFSLLSFKNFHPHRARNWNNQWSKCTHVIKGNELCTTVAEICCVLLVMTAAHEGGHFKRIKLSRKTPHSYKLHFSCFNSDARGPWFEVDDDGDAGCGLLKWYNGEIMRPQNNSEKEKKSPAACVTFRSPLGSSCAWDLDAAHAMEHRWEVNCLPVSDEQVHRLECGPVTINDNIEPQPKASYEGR